MVNLKALLIVVACLMASYAVAQAPPQRGPRGGPPLTVDQGRQKAAQVTPLTNDPLKQPVAPGTAAPATPLSPEQMPSSPPQVSFNSGILTIIASNSSLSDILRAVHRQTGAVVDSPGNATERVVGKFGPGPARDVLSSLLNGSHFNYVLLGSATNPNALERVMLISRSVGGEQSAQQANAGVPPNPAAPAAVMPQPGEPVDASSDDAATEMPQDANDTVDDQANQEQPEDQQQPQQPAPFGQGGVKTPEQLLQELQQRQQQMQQQQQPGAPQSFPQAPMGAQPPQPPH